MKRTHLAGGRKENSPAGRYSARQSCLGGAQRPSSASSSSSSTSSSSSSSKSRSTVNVPDFSPCPCLLVSATISFPSVSFVVSLSSSTLSTCSTFSPISFSSTFSFSAAFSFSAFSFSSSFLFSRLSCLLLSLSSSFSFSSISSYKEDLCQICLLKKCSQVTSVLAMT